MLESKERENLHTGNQQAANAYKDGVHAYSSQHINTWYNLK